LTVSIGIASYPEDANSREELIIASDQAMYFAKEAGRNQVCCYGNTLKSAIEKDQKKLSEILNNPEMKALRDLAAAIDAKSHYTRGHSEAVVQYSLLLADALNLTEEDKKSLQLAGLLHNIGTVSIPDRLLNKPNPLSPEEVSIIQSHPKMAQMLIKQCSQMEAVLPAILYHHEHYDGNGYPNGLRGDDIPFLARVLGIVEAYEAMTSIRPYRPKLTPQQAMDELRRHAGTQFDPQIVEVFVNRLSRSS
jgi:HD-GYP domain-containing protein (c-di-GMP phosphodiesterase class II)